MNTVASLSCAALLVLLVFLLWLAHDDYDFLACASLLMIMLLSCTSPRPKAFAPPERFSETPADTNAPPLPPASTKPAASNATSRDSASFVSKIVAIPSQIRDTIAPSLDKLINSASDEALGGGEAMMNADYMEDAPLQTRGNFDEKKFEKLQDEYRSIDRLLVSMKDYSRPTYDAIVAVAAGRR